MSHFTVMVIGENVDAQLAPFQENNMGDCPPEYMEFNDMTDEVRDEYDELGADGKEKYPTFELYVEDYHGYKAHEIDGETRYGYYENPNAKWDWYQVGGRWSGFLKLKAGAEGEHGDRSWMRRGEPVESGYCDSAAKGNIDFEGMRQEDADKAGATWDKAHALIAGRAFKTWEQCRAEHAIIDTAREVYHAQDVVKEFRQSESFGWFTKPEDFTAVTREAHVAHARAVAINTYAVLKDGEWYEKGEMGWWGLSNDKMTDTEWAVKVGELIDSLSDDTRITIVDCHI